MSDAKKAVEFETLQKLARAGMISVRDMYDRMQLVNPQDARSAEMQNPQEFGGFKVLTSPKVPEGGAYFLSANGIAEISSGMSSYTITTSSNTEPVQTTAAEVEARMKWAQAELAEEGNRYVQQMADEIQFGFSQWYGAGPNPAPIPQEKPKPKPSQVVDLNPKRLISFDEV